MVAFSRSACSYRTAPPTWRQGGRCDRSRPIGRRFFRFLGGCGGGHFTGKAKTCSRSPLLSCDFCQIFPLSFLTICRTKRPPVSHKNRGFARARDLGRRICSNFRRPARAAALPPLAQKAGRPSACAIFAAAFPYRDSIPTHFKNESPRLGRENQRQNHRGGISSNDGEK